MKIWEYVLLNLFFWVFLGVSEFELKMTKIHEFEFERKKKNLEYEEQEAPWEEDGKPW